jgi:hypothetical protein
MQKISAGKFHFEPPFTSFDHLIGAREQRRRPIEVERLGSLACCFAPVARAFVRFEFCRTHLARKIGRRHPAKR